MFFQGDLYCSSNLNRMIKPRIIRWAGHVAHMGRRGMRKGFWWEGQKERDHTEDVGVGGRIIIK
jgi:hypothetical protein